MLHHFYFCTIVLCTEPKVFLPGDWVNLITAVATIGATAIAAWAAKQSKDSAKESATATAATLEQVRATQSMANTMKEQVNTIDAQTKAAIQLQLLSGYQNTQKLEAEAATATEKDAEIKAKRYYRESFDLLFTEYNLWCKGLIENAVMLVWVRYRHRMFKKKNVIESETGAKLPNYQDEWVSFSKTFIEAGDGFTNFVNYIHENEVKSMDELKKFKP